MATTYKTLGQVQSSGTISTYDTLYTVPSATATVVSTISICNTGATAATIRLSASSSTTPATKEWLIYGFTVPANESKFITIGATLDTTVKYLMCSASSSNVAFSAFGSEVTA